MTGLVALHVGLASVALVAVVNARSSGEFYRSIDVGLGVALIVLLGLAFLVFGLQHGMAAVGARIAYGIFFKFAAKFISLPALRLHRRPPERRAPSGRDYMERRVSLDKFMKSLEKEA